VTRRPRGDDDVRDEGAGVPQAEAGAAAPEPAAAPTPASPAEPAPEDAATLRDRWLRAEAELQNYRRRAAREREEARRSAEEAVMLEIIAALDDLDRALATAGEGDAAGSWLQCVRLVAARLVDALARQGVVPEDPAGLPFDPRFQEAVLEMESAEVPAGHVAQVVLRGWRRGERALRAARVVVARGPAGAA